MDSSYEWDYTRNYENMKFILQIIDAETYLMKFLTKKERANVE